MADRLKLKALGKSMVSIAFIYRVGNLKVKGQKINNFCPMAYLITKPFISVNFGLRMLQITDSVRERPLRATLATTAALSAQRLDYVVRG